MEKRAFGKTDMLVSVLGFGASEIGFEGTDQGTVDQLLGTALDAGLNVIDTAECYKVSEELIGNTISHRRDDYYLFTKCGHASGLDFKDWDPKMLELSIDRSLKRLKTDYVDLIQLHSCPEEILRQGDVIEVLQRAREKGKTRYIGFSGDHTDGLYAIHSGVFDSMQTSVSIADQEAIDLTIPEALKRGMGIIAKRPIANAAWKHKETPANSYHVAYWERLQQLAYEFLQSDLEAAVATALRFTLSIPGVQTAIVGTTKPDRWVQNARLLEAGPLPKDQFEAIQARWRDVRGKDWFGRG
jgi:aryl-alcohol dehydrogenase-like predicted oxidoreductase